MSSPDSIAAKSPARLVHAQQLGHRVAQRLVPFVGLAERDLRHRVAATRVRRPDGVRRGTCRAGCRVTSRSTTCASFQPRFTASCTPVLSPCPPCGGCTCAASPASSTRPARYAAAWRVMSVKREIQVGLCAPKSVPYATDERVAEILPASGSPVVLDSALLQHDAVRASAVHRGRRADAAALAAQADLRLVVHLDLGDHPAGRWDPARGSRCRRPCGPRCVRRRSRRGTARAATRRRTARRRRRCRPARSPITSRSRRIGTPSSSTQPAEDALEVALPEREPVVVARREVADVQRMPGEPLDLQRLPLPRGTAPRCRADRAPRWCASAGRRRASRRAS